MNNHPDQAPPAPDLKTRTGAFTAPSLQDLAQQIADRQHIEGWEVVCHSLVFVAAPFGADRDEWHPYRALVTYKVPDHE